MMIYSQRVKNHKHSPSYISDISVVMNTLDLRTWDLSTSYCTEKNTELLRITNPTQFGYITNILQANLEDALPEYVTITITITIAITIAITITVMIKLLIIIL